MKFSPQKIARIGEQIIYDILPKSKWNNSLKESFDYFDIEWMGIKIDVKTTTYRLRNGFQASTSASVTGKKDYIFVVVGIENDKQYFWILKNPRVGCAYLKLKDAVSKENLPNEILKIASSDNLKSNPAYEMVQT